MFYSQEANKKNRGLESHKLHKIADSLSNYFLEHHGPYFEKLSSCK